MKSTIFIDTSGFFALLVKEDRKHHQALQVLRQATKHKQRFITTDYILDETVTLLRARGLNHLIASFFDTIFTSHACSVVWMDQESFIKTKTFFLKSSDQGWSFTDCASFVVMKEMKLNLALTTDKHFQEAGLTVLLV